MWRNWLVKDACDRGFAITAGCFTLGECDALGAIVQNEAVTRSRAGARHLMSLAAIRDFTNDTRLIDLAREWLGDTAVPFRATLFEKSGSANWLIPWHQDTALPIASRTDAAGWGSWSKKAGVLYAHAPALALSRLVALRVHLDDSWADNGPLQVIPGSHRGGVLSDGEVSDAVLAGQPTQCCVRAGGVIAMRPLTIHCSAKMRSLQARRVLHVEYADCLDLGGVRLAVV